MFKRYQPDYQGLRQYRMPAIIIALLVLGGCQLLRPTPDINKGPLLQHKTAPSAGEILHYRDQWCGRSVEERLGAMNMFDQDNPPARFEQLLIASCEPGRYPGRLAIAVKQLQKFPDPPPAVSQMVALVGSFSDSQQVHLSDISKLKTKLDETIQAIRVIEEGINQRTDEGVTP